MAAHSSLVAWNENKLGEKFVVKIGGGYARFDYTTSKDYFTLKYGLNYSIGEKTKLTLFQSNYMLAFSDTQTDKGTATVKKYFSNLDLGIAFPTSKKWSLQISSLSQSLQCKKEKLHLDLALYLISGWKI